MEAIKNSNQELKRIDNETKHEGEVPFTFSKTISSSQTKL